MEFQEMARRMVAAGRVNLGVLLYYAAKRYLNKQDIFG